MNRKKAFVDIVQDYIELRVYKAAYQQAMAVFSASKKFPPDERFSLTDQARRSSRSVCANMAEAWAKRRYPAHFLSKLTDCDGENRETAEWLSFAHDCGYLNSESYAECLARNREIGASLGSMIKGYMSFTMKTKA